MKNRKLRRKLFRHRERALKERLRRQKNAKKDKRGKRERHRKVIRLKERVEEIRVKLIRRTRLPRMRTRSSIIRSSFKST